MSNIKIIANKEAILTNDNIKQMINMFNIVDKDSTGIHLTESGDVEIVLNEGVKMGLISSEQFQSLLEDSNINIKNIVLWFPCPVSILDKEVPESFPYSTVLAKKDEDDNEIEPKRQLTVREYFQTESDDNFALIATKYMRSGNNVYYSSDYPDKETFLLFMSFLAPYIAELAAYDQFQQNTELLSLLEPLSNKAKDLFKQYLMNPENA